MTATASTFTVTNDGARATAGVTATEFARMVNDAAAAGRVDVNGREAWARFGGTVATAWANGSVSVDVRGRTRTAQGTVWVKAGQSATVTV